MKYLSVNIVPVCFLLLAAFLVWMKSDGWGWCIFGAIITHVSIREIKP